MKNVGNQILTTTFWARRVMIAHELPALLKHLRPHQGGQRYGGLTIALGRPICAGTSGTLSMRK